MVRKKTKPEPEPDPIHKSAQPLKRRRPIRTFSRKGLSQVHGRTVRDNQGYFWIHDATAEDELTKNKIIAFLTKNKKETKVIKNGDVFEIFVKKDDETYFRVRKG
jgi:hypothetical protein